MRPPSRSKASFRPPRDRSAQPGQTKKYCLPDTLACSHFSRTSRCTQSSSSPNRFSRVAPRFGLPSSPASKPRRITGETGSSAAIASARPSSYDRCPGPYPPCSSDIPAPFCDLLGRIAGARPVRQSPPSRRGICCRARASMSSTDRSNHPQLIRPFPFTARRSFGKSATPCSARPLARYRRPYRPVRIGIQPASFRTSDTFNSKHADRSTCPLAFSQLGQCPNVSNLGGEVSCIPRVETPPCAHEAIRMYEKPVFDVKNEDARTAKLTATHAHNSLGCHNASRRVLCACCLRSIKSTSHTAPFGSRCGARNHRWTRNMSSHFP